VKTLIAVATLSVALVASMSANAQSSTSSTSTAAADSSATSKAKAQELKTKQQADQKDIDAEITNAKMRAESGSKSKHSFSMDLSYSGGTVNSPVAYRRPNIAGAEATPTLTSLGGEINYRYRISPEYSMTAGVGLEMIAPGFELENSDADAGSQKYDVSNPGVGFSRSFKKGRFQNISSLSATYYTNKELKAMHYRSSFGVGHTALTEIGTSGWQLGLSVSLATYDYSEVLGTGAAQVANVLGIYPFVEYAINDTYNFRTVFRGSSFSSRKSDPDKYRQGEPTQSMGLGIAATRDIFLYPNIQWTWHHPTADKTNVALAATMNFL
jgi:hypothetical protein